MAYKEQKRMHPNSLEERQMMKDPARANARIYVGNIPTDSMTKQDLQDMFSPFGKIEGILLNRGFGFIQFVNEESAQEALKPQTKVIFRGVKVEVRPARPWAERDKRDYRERDRSPIDRGDFHDNRGRDQYLFRERYNAGPLPNSDRANDCEIIVVNKAQTEYAEYIEMRLKKMGLTVDLLFPNEDVPVARVLANIANRGTLYAIVILAQNEEHRSLTLNILHGQPQEHRNMPLEDAVTFLSRNFEAYLLKEKQNAPSVPSEVNVAPALGTYIAQNLTDRHPEAIQILLNLLADNRQLTVLQYDRVIQYIQTRRELQVKLELGETSTASSYTGPGSGYTATITTVGGTTAASKQQAELQNRILSILNTKVNQTGAGAAPAAAPVPVPAPVVAAAQPSGAANNNAAAAAATTSSPLLNDPNVQKALNSLIGGKLFDNIVGARAPQRF